MKVTDKISIDKINIFHAVLKSKGGRYLENPVIIGDLVRVNYEFSEGSDYKEFCERYAELTTDITETRRGFLKKIKNKLSKLKRSSKR